MRRLPGLLPALAAASWSGSSVLAANAAAGCIQARAIYRSQEEPFGCGASSDVVALHCSAECLARAREGGLLPANGIGVEVDYVTAEQCQQACQGQDGCTHFAYDTNRGVYRHACWLQASGSCLGMAYVTAPGFISGPRECSGGWDGPSAVEEDWGDEECFYSEADYGDEVAGSCGHAELLGLHGTWACLAAATAGRFWPAGASLSERIYESPARCRQACEETPGCEYFTYKEVEGDCYRSCWLKAALSCSPGFGVAEDCVSGPRHCENLTTTTSSTADASGSLPPTSTTLAPTTTYTSTWTTTATTSSTTTTTSNPTSTITWTSSATSSSTSSTSTSTSASTSTSTSTSASTSTSTSTSTSASIFVSTTSTGTSTGTGIGTGTSTTLTSSTRTGSSSSTTTSITFRTTTSAEAGTTSTTSATSATSTTSTTSTSITTSTTSTTGTTGTTTGTGSSAASPSMTITDTTELATSTTTTATWTHTATIVTASSTASWTSATTTITTTLSSIAWPACVGAPEVLFGPEQAHCTDVPHGSPCDIHCNAGYSIKGSVVCQEGEWMISGACVPEGAPAVTVRAVLLTLAVTFASQAIALNSSVLVNAASWAEANFDTLALASASALGLPAGSVRLQVAAGMQRLLRRLASAGDAASLLPGGSLTLSLAALLGSNSSSSSGSDVAGELQRRLVAGFAAALAEGLSQASLNVSVEAIGTAQFVEEFSVAPAQWLLGPWGSCSITGCEGAEGERWREVRCAAGYAAACEQEEGPRPEEAQLCVSSVPSCGFDPSCPFGRESFLGCEAQRWSISIVALALIGLLLWAVARTLRAKFICQRSSESVYLAKTPSPAEEHEEAASPAELELVRKAASEPVQQSTQDRLLFETLPGVGIRAARRVIRPEDVNPSLPEGTEGVQSDGGLAMRATKSENAVGKARVVYEYDMQEALDWLAKQQAEAPVSPATEVASRTPGGKVGKSPQCGSACSPHFWRDRGKADKSDSDSGAEDGESTKRALKSCLLAVDLAFAAGARRREASEPQRQSRSRVARFAFEAYEEGQRVEYFSRRHRAWQTGLMHLRHLDDGPGRPPKVIYVVELLPSKQLRHGATLDLLRAPLQEGELVEVYRRRSEGFEGDWLPGLVDGQQASLAAVVGYSVEIPGEGIREHGLPASRLRRRFPEGSSVEVYRGVERGWVLATVRPEREAIRWGRTMTLHSWLSSALPMVNFAMSSSSSAGAAPSALSRQGSRVSGRTGGRADEGPAAARGPEPRSLRRLLRSLATRRHAAKSRREPPEALEEVAVHEEPLEPEPTPSSPSDEGKEREDEAARRAGLRAEVEAYKRVRSRSRQGQALPPSPQSLCLVLVGARGLRGPDGQRRRGMSRSAGAICSCAVTPERPGGVFQTPCGSGAAADPVWTCGGEIADHTPGESLTFTVLDKDEQLLGKATLESALFHPDGFDGELSLLNAAGRRSGGFLRLQVLPAEPELWTEVPILEEEDTARERQPEWVPLYLLRSRERRGEEEEYCV